MSIRKILSIDGGGIKGVFPASFLMNLEVEVGGPIGKYFDFIVGTSTGGIIALALALGISAHEVLHFYENYCPRIFEGDRSARWFRAVGASKYDVEALERPA